MLRRLPTPGARRRPTALPASFASRGIFCFLIVAAVASIAGDETRAACPPGYPNPITSGDPGAGSLVVLTGLGPAPTGSFFLLGAGDAANSGTLPLGAWLHQAGDVDGDGRPDWYLDAPATGPGGWGDPATVGCPSLVVPDHPPLVIILQHAVEDLDGDGRFDVFEDRNRNGLLDPGEDRDGDGRLTPPDGCEGVLREDSDCDGRADIVNEDVNHNGVLDPGEDVDGDGHLDLGNDDRNGNFSIDDRPVLYPDDPVRDENGRLNYLYPYGEKQPGPGGSIVLVVAWNGQAYSLQSISEPGTIVGPDEDLDHDGHFDVFEDRNHNHRLDPGEDLDGDGRLTPPGGCEGATREDADCDGRLDRVDEDANHNGILDPGEDLDGDGHLDAGDEDRNGNNLLDDRPDPRPADAVGVYPYGLFLPRPLRLLHAGPAGPQFRVTGVHTDPAGALRLRFETDGLRLLTDAAVPGPVFDHVVLALDHDAGPPGPVPEGTRRFVESLSPRLDLPSGSNLAAGAFLSIDLPGGRRLHPILPLDLHARSAGSDAFLAGPGGIRGLGLADLLDPDEDHVPASIDPCPELGHYQEFDHNLDGIGDACDPVIVIPGSTISDRWVSVGGDAGPGPRRGAAAAFDPARGVMVLFGGSDDGATWEFDGSAWRSFAPSPSPSARRGHAMVWDGDRRRVVLFGGEGAADRRLLADQWEYDAARHRWSMRPLQVTPGPRAGFGLARDERLRALVLFGGLDGTRLLGDTWMFRMGMWRRIPTAQTPAPRSGAVLAYDARRERTVLIGGRGPSDLGNLLDDVWEFDGTAWQPVDVRGDLPPTADATLGWDPIRREVVLFGGETLHAQPGIINLPVVIGPMASTVRFDGIRISQLPTRDTTREREVHAGAIDAQSGDLIVQGGISTTGPLDDTAALRRAPDADEDGIPDLDDDCPGIADPAQADLDRDGAGDRCDDCPQIANPDQRDLDRDLVGDACDDDRDGDGVPNLGDVCPDAYVAGRPLASIGAGGGGDRDGDGRPDDCDRCPDDPADDADGDGFCANEDNCPATANPMQQDADADGAGDACQPVVRILSIDPNVRPRNTLNARVQLRDPNGDRLAGRIEISRAVVLPEILAAHLDPCAAAWSPDGAPGGGLIYAIVPGTAPVITDVDAIYGCFDGIPDFEFFDGTCAAGAGRLGAEAITVDHPTPFPICVRRLDGSGALFDLELRQAAPDAAFLSGPGGPIRSFAWSDRLPSSVPLAGLGAPGTYLLRVGATDGTTPEVSDERPFAWNGERLLFFNLPGWLTGGN
ncbi:MAG TPA: thrombospondin type 3 repeat-containing protein [Dongiaceae bacterium]|nr:thrombospondin type 3 repeat-containing protein [Dongiaceae bacterium]